MNKKIKIHVSANVTKSVILVAIKFRDIERYFNSIRCLHLPTNTLLCPLEGIVPSNAIKKSPWDCILQNNQIIEKSFLKQRYLHGIIVNDE